jgi:hypothetical protein
VDQNGDMVVDTFKLPSACVCNYRGKFGLNFRNGLAGASEPPKCSAEDATSNLEALETTSEATVSDLEPQSA